MGIRLMWVKGRGQLLTEHLETSQSSRCKLLETKERADFWPRKMALRRYRTLSLSRLMKEKAAISKVAGAYKVQSLLAYDKSSASVLCLDDVEVWSHQVVCGEATYIDGTREPA